MSLPIDGPCSCGWIDDWAAVVACCDIADGMPQAKQMAVMAIASEVLYALSGHRYPGWCSTTATPCVPCRCAHRPCSCQPVEQIDLGWSWPVREVTDVIVDDHPLPSDAWRLDDNRWLVRIDGGRWPRCSTDGTFRVSYVYGREVPEGGKNAARLLACELAKQCEGDPSCQLPKNTTSISREGVTLAIQNPMDFLAEGRVGLYEVDLWLASATRRPSTSGIFDPARRPLRRIGSEP